MVDLKTLKQLVRLMIEHDLTELDVEAEGVKVKLKRGSGNPEVQVIPAGASVAQTATSNTAASAASASKTGKGENGEEADGVSIKSPMVGTFYTAPSPDSPPFVSVGDRVDSNTVVCIIEAMKVFNEIKAETHGTITKVLVENGQAVEFNQPLFQVKPE